ncbi:MAG TPA: hypothetical protein PK916_12805 [Bacteroidota bacterium]|mgnify:CR=1 FL=1|nr:hypothetical protein [Bacteroidota bacterium]
MNIGRKIVHRAMLAALLLCAPLALRAQMVVITHASVPVKSISVRELLDVYTLNQSRWDDGTRITVVDVKSGKGRDAFFEYIGMSPEEMQRIWLRKQFTGKARPPRSVGSEEDVVDLVAATEGAIGYVNERALKSGKSVRIIARFK